MGKEKGLNIDEKGITEGPLSIALRNDVVSGKTEKLSDNASINDRNR